MKLIKSIVAHKVRQFHAAATCAFMQKEAEKIWGEQVWKFGLTADELLSISDGWAEFVVTGNTSKIDSACKHTINRLTGVVENLPNK